MSNLYLCKPEQQWLSATVVHTPFSFLYSSDTAVEILKKKTFWYVKQLNLNLTDQEYKWINVCLQTQTIFYKSNFKAVVEV